jgi:hypothetical protein
MARRPIRIAVLHFAHETVTFLKHDTTLDDFIYPGSPAKGEALLAHDARSYMGGFVKVAREFDGVELVGIDSPLWPKTGTGSGWITQEAYETFVGKMIAEIAATGKFDGVYLCLHGAMGVRGVPRPEAELARRVRLVVGPEARQRLCQDHSSGRTGRTVPGRGPARRTAVPERRSEELLPLWRAEVSTRVVLSEAKDLMPFQRACRLQSQ